MLSHVPNASVAPSFSGSMHYCVSSVFISHSACFPPDCRLSSEWRSQVNLHQRQCDHVTVIICYLTFDFPFLLLSLIFCFIFCSLFVQTWSALRLWCLSAPLVSDLSICRDHDSEKSLQRGWEPRTFREKFNLET